MEKMTVKAARQVDNIGRQVCVEGWVRTRRDSKGGFSFIEVNDGSCFDNLQIIADGALENYEDTVRHLSPGCSVTDGSFAPDSE